MSDIFYVEVVSANLTELPRDPGNDAATVPLDGPGPDPGHWRHDHPGPLSCPSHCILPPLVSRVQDDAVLFLAQISRGGGGAE